MHLGVLCVPRAVLQCTVASLRDFCAFMLQHHPTPKAPIQCKVHYVSIPTLEVRQIKRALAASAAGRGRGRGRRVARSSIAVRKKLSKQVIYRKWPVLRPSSMAMAMLATEEGASMLCLCVHEEIL